MQDVHIIICFIIFLYFFTIYNFIKIYINNNYFKYQQFS
jgi:hypothetical protein